MIPNELVKLMMLWTTGPWSESLLSTWRKFASLAIQNVPSEDSDKTAQACRLIWIYVVHKCPEVIFWCCSLVKFLPNLCVLILSSECKEWCLNSHLFRNGIFKLIGGAGSRINPLWVIEITTDGNWQCCRRTAGRSSTISYMNMELKFVQIEIIRDQLVCHHHHVSSNKIACAMSPICMKYQILLSEKKRKNITNMSSAELGQR